MFGTRCVGSPTEYNSLEPTKGSSLSLANTWGIPYPNVIATARQPAGLHRRGEIVKQLLIFAAVIVVSACAVREPTPARQLPNVRIEANADIRDISDDLINKTAVRIRDKGFPCSSVSFAGVGGGRHLEVFMACNGGIVGYRVRFDPYSVKWVVYPLR